MLVPQVICPTKSKTQGAKLLLLQSPPFWTIVDKTRIDKDMELKVEREQTLLNLKPITPPE